jgi:hypothetical protein
MMQITASHSVQTQRGPQEWTQTSLPMRPDEPVTRRRGEEK